MIEYTTFRSRCNSIKLGICCFLLCFFPAAFYMAEFLTLFIDGIDLKEGFVRIFEIQGKLINDAKFGRNYKLI